MNWWRSNSTSGQSLECSDEDMKAILESVIFINNVKIPPQVGRYWDDEDYRYLHCMLKDSKFCPRGFQVSDGAILVHSYKLLNLLVYVNYL